MQALKTRPDAQAEPARVRSIQPSTESPVPADIPYERQPPGAVPRRWLLAIVLLLLLNVVATTSISWGPAVVESARRALADRRAAAAKAQADAAKAAAEAAAAQRVAALQAQAALYVVPAGRVVYTEDPGEAERLLDGEPGYSTVESANPGNREVRLPHLPVQWKGPPELEQLVHGLNLSQRGAAVMLHERRTPSGRRVIVYVEVESAREISSGHDSDGGHFVSASTPFRLSSTLVHPAPASSASSWHHALTLRPSDARTLLMRPNTDSSAPDAGAGIVERKPQVMRVLAGRPDPDDPTHFEIKYTLDGRAGTIDGWVREDGRLRIEPREGAKTVESFDSSGAETWDPSAPTPPKRSGGGTVEAPPSRAATRRVD